VSEVKCMTRVQSAAKTFVSGSRTISPVVLRLARGDTVTLTLKELEDAIASDPEFLMRTLALANSAYYSQQHDISSLRTALVVLGAETVHNLALSLLARSLHNSSSSMSDSLWKHCQAAGVAAQMLAEVQRTVSPRSAFAAGLLHDIGLLAIDTLSHENNVPLSDHALLGAEIADRLGLSPSLSEAIRTHDDESQSNQEESLLASTVRAANEIALRSGYTHDSEHEPDENTISSSFARLNLNEEDIGALVAALPVRMHQQADVS